MGISRYYYIQLLLFAFIASVCTMSARADIPPMPDNANDLIYDYAGIIESRYHNEIRDSLRSIYFSNETAGSQVVVLTVKSLDGMSIEQYAHDVLESWGIGSNKLDNGLLILIKPKTGESPDEKGQVRIETGYGLEAALPDILCRQLETDSMMPEFKKNNYGLGILKSVKAVVPIVKGEYPPQCEAFLSSHQEEDGDDEPLSLSAIIVYVILYLFIFGLIWYIFFLPYKKDWYSIAQSPLFDLEVKATKAHIPTGVAHGTLDLSNNITANKKDEGKAAKKDDDKNAKEEDSIAGDIAANIFSAVVSIGIGALLGGGDCSFGGGSGGGGGASGSW